MITIAERNFPKQKKGSNLNHSQAVTPRIPLGTIAEPTTGSYNLASTINSQLADEAIVGNNYLDRHQNSKVGTYGLLRERAAH